MAHMNFSRPGQTGQDKPSLVDRSFFFSIGLVIIVAVVFLVLKFYSTQLGAQAAELQQEIENQTARLHTPEAQRVTDFSFRQREASRHSQSVASPANLLVNVQRFILPEVTLLSYEYDEPKQEIMLQASTADFRFVALQLMTFKSGEASSLYDTVLSQAAGRDQDGTVRFGVKLHLAQGNM